jgi:hypothetical protein
MRFSKEPQQQTAKNHANPMPNQTKKPKWANLIVFV